MFGIDDAVLLGVGGTLASGLLNNSAAASRQSNAQDFSAQQFATRYQTTTRDMQAAGLNPMLAYSQGGGSSPTSSAASSSGVGDIGASFSQSRMTSAQVELTKAQTDAASAQAAKTRAETPTGGGNLGDADIGSKSATADQARSMANLADNQANEIGARIEAGQPKLLARISELEGDALVQRLKANLPLEEAEKLAAATLELQEHVNLLKQKGYSEAQSREVMKATINKMAVDNRFTDVRRAISEQDERAGASFGEVGKTVGALEPFLRLLWSAFRRN